ncbi:hypothetical protein E2320_009222, partial [Naja naja]
GTGWWKCSSFSSSARRGWAWLLLFFFGRGWAYI